MFDIQLQEKLPFNWIRSWKKTKKNKKKLFENYLKVTMTQHPGKACEFWYGNDQYLLFKVSHSLANKDCKRKLTTVLLQQQ